jgi:adenosylcobinamide-GDP ribazoletransferase
VHRRRAAAAAVNRERRPSAWRAALGMFTVIPVPATAIDNDTAGRAVLWLPAVGLLLTVPAAAGLLAIEAPSESAPRRLLGATVAITVLALLSGGLHLDGLADTADGLISRRPREEALAIMRRGDVGPLGIAVLLLVVLLQITSLAVLPGPAGAGALVTASVTARVAVVLATGPSTPAARPAGFGALVAGRTAAPARAGAAAALVVAVTTVSGLTGGLPLAVRALVAVAAGLLTAAALRRAAQHRLGGVTGDVFGALIEAATAITLLVLAASA